MERLLKRFPRNWMLFAYFTLFIIVFLIPLIELLRYCLHPKYSRYNSYIVFIPIVSGYLLYGKRDAILEKKIFSPAIGIPVILTGLLLFVFSYWKEPTLNQTDLVSFRTFSVVVCCIGGFLLLFGLQSFRTAIFPVLFLGFLVPMPTALLERTNQFLQAASSEMINILFLLTSVPLLREGNLFHLPGVSINIAPECSGMRATITLFIIGVLASHLFLKSGWRKIAAVSSVLPITILGNGIRIVVLTFLAIHVNANFLRGDAVAHERGGWVLFLIDLFLFGVVITLLGRGEKLLSVLPSVEKE